MTWVAHRVTHRLEILLYGYSSDSEILDCIVDLLQNPDYDVVYRALVNAVPLADYDVVPEARMQIVMHLAGLFATRRELRIAVLYRDIAVGDLGLFAEQFRASTGFDFEVFVDRRAAEAWLV